MTVNTIDERALRHITEGHGDPGLMSFGIRLLDTAIMNTTKETWEFIKVQLNRLPDMAYTCMRTMYMGKPAKQFIFTGTNEIALKKAIEFVRATINDGATVAVVCTTNLEVEKSDGQLLGKGANCPLFSKGE